MTTPDSPQLESRLEFAVEIAQQAGDQTLELFRTAELGFERKSDGSPVTAADRGAEEFLRRRIGERFPEDAILGEEFGETPGTSGFRWALDPIDGTKSFLAGVPLYTTLVGVLLDNEPKIGVICAPAAGETVYAAKGLGCWHLVGAAEPRRTAVSTVEDLADAVFVTTSVRSFSTYRDPRRSLGVRPIPVGMPPHSSLGRRLRLSDGSDRKSRNHDRPGDEPLGRLGSPAGDRRGGWPVLRLAG